MKGILTFYLVFLAIFFAMAPFLTLMLYAETDLSLSLLPQLIGFCLQGTFLVVVFSIYEKRSSLNSKRNHKFALRTFLSNFVDPCLDSSHTEAGFLQSQQLFLEGMEKLRANGLKEQTATKIQQIAEKSIPSMETLTVIAAQVDHMHLEMWGVLLEDSRNIRDADSETATSNATIKLLENIQQFDELDIF
ncbi:MAG: hypothetical protein HQL70_00285 [Magnetococcales bacterium]|nr:hypothetical protein [Magnetococcales bacterium]